MNSRLLTSLAAAALLGACATGPDRSSADEPADLAVLADRLAAADVVFVGEEHGNMVGHLQTLHLLRLLHEKRPQLALSMEMIERHQQADLDAWLADEIDTATFLERTGLTRSYVERYHPMVEFCKAQGLPVIAANLPRELVGRLRREGFEAIKDEPFMPREISAPHDDYFDAFVGVMAEAHGEVDPADLEPFYMSQCAWDDTMAESIADFLAAAGEPQPLVVHVVGKFHVENKLGTARKLAERQPDLELAVVSMQQRANWAALDRPGTYALFVPPQADLPKLEMPTAVAGEAEVEVAEDPGRPALGFMPDYEAGADGMRIGALREDGPAEAAGLREGDVIIEMDGVAIDGMDAYLEILGSLTPGKKVEVVVDRDGETKACTVTVGRRID